MKIENNIAQDVKIAYIGGGSRGWAWTLMNDLATCTLAEAKALFRKMVQNTANYLTDYDLTGL